MPRPSFGCQSCRLRRIKVLYIREYTCILKTDSAKCDEREGGCRNCARFGILCPGYPEAFDVLHRQHIATVPATEAPSALQQQTFPIPSEHLPDANQNLGSPAASISFENDEFALALYYACYCIEGTNRWSMADLQREGNGCLLAAAKLMGYQAMMQKWLVPNANSTLHRSYTIATSLLNEALSTESDRCRDSTLLTVILLGAVETKACSDQSTRSWVAHSRGAATLLQMRGRMQSAISMWEYWLMLCPSVCSRPFTSYKRDWQRHVLPDRTPDLRQLSSGEMRSGSQLRRAQPGHRGAVRAGS